MKSAALKLLFVILGKVFLSKQKFIKFIRDKWVGAFFSCFFYTIWYQNITFLEADTSNMWWYYATFDLEKEASEMHFYELLDIYSDTLNPRKEKLSSAACLSL